ncbi:unnamed protein product (macronuclear) [Paramecium tetraurelia]|uniref:Calcium-dependent protein kinase 1 n=1 Tax=Paramecium tetraurelia TaxID=5888 RepID=A0BZZ1_PARTE|nr:uncharacterized protein GSPATT00005960001 [Paramecium tetraurelia]CAK64108.1 unnamed protein product [Paramecium tetraurelia]|eukprot:XP_001431506.1 hypothetical protein (macronuclear) [Paramecium tetraurelia strain d4-2]
MGAQCCTLPTKLTVYEIDIDSQKLRGSAHTQTKRSVIKRDQKSDEEIINCQKENYKDFEVLGSGSIDLSQMQDKIPCQNKLFQKQESQIESTIPRSKFQRKITNSSVGSVKLGAEVFINLKSGSIHKYYETGEILGQGAYGKVWKVTHKNTGMIRAMKELKKKSIIIEEQQRLFAEMNILKNLDHPHIVKLYELYQDQHNYYLITEYLQGGELFDRIKEFNYFSERKAAELMRQILSAVVYCHQRSIVHRDLKPENVLFVNDSQLSPIKIIDFGTSRKYEQNQKMTKKLGTAYYIAPEVLKQEYNEKCDVWSCGIILYILLCGYPPFTGKTEEEIMQKVCEGELIFEQEDWEMISTEVKDLIRNMLQVDPNKRYSAQEALSDPWIKKNQQSTKVNKTALQNLQKFQAQSVFTQAVLAYIACQMTSQQEQDELAKSFQFLDKNGDGILSRDELIEGYTSVFRNKQQAIQEVDKILSIVDINQSGQVDFSEFLMAAMNQEKLVSLEKVKAAFKIFDANEDGKISKNELELMIGTVEDDIWQQILIECGAQGEITEQQFINILLHQKH